MQYLQALAWLTEQEKPQKQANIELVKAKSASGFKKLSQDSNQKNLDFKSLKHKEKTKPNKNLAIESPYEAFGEVDYQLGSIPNKYLFTGEQYDNNVGFYYLRARFYNPSNGRFTQMDTFAGMANSPLSLNKYTYAHENPISLTDPSGNYSLIESAVATTIASVSLNIGITLYSVIQSGAGGTTRPDALLVSFRPIGAASQIGAIGVSGSAGIDLVVHRNGSTVAFASWELGISSGVLRYPRPPKFSLSGEWSVGAIWNLKNARDFKGFGAGASWPGVALTAFCGLPGQGGYGVVFRYACHARGSMRYSPLTMTFGFSGIKGSGFLSFGKQGALQTSLFGWATPVYDSDNSTVSEIKNKVRNIPSDGQALFNLATGLNKN